MSKSKIVLVLDVTSSNVAESVSVILQFVLQRMYNTPENSIAVMLAGTKNTDVELVNGNTANFNNISLVRPLLQGDQSLITLIQDIPDKYYKDSVKISLVPALEASVRLFYQEKTKTHHMSENRIMLFTDNKGLFDGNSGFVAKEMNNLKNQIIFKLIGPQLYDSVTETQSLVSRLPRNCQAMYKFCSSVVQGENLSTSDALEITRIYKKKKTRQFVPFKGCLEIGSGTKLPVYVVSKVARAIHQQSFKKCDEGGEGVVFDRVYHLNDEKQTHVDPDFMNKGYRYGRNYIPISTIDAGLMSSETNKEFVLICTTKRSNIRKEELLTTSAYSVTSPASDAAGGTALHAFATALDQLNMVAICRYVKKEDAAVELCCLVPNVKEYCACLMMFDLPFANDIRKAEFPRIKASPTEDQLSAVDSLISSMDLSSKPEFKASAIPHPDIQRRYECVTHKVLHPNQPFPAADIQQFFKSPKFEASDSAVKACNAAFAITKQELKAKKRTAGDMFTENVDTNNELKKVKKEDICLDDLLGSEMKIGTTSPVQDFLLVQNKLGPKAACRQLCEVITSLVQHDGYHVTDCLRSLRECAVREGLYEMFNEFLKEAFTHQAVKKICKERMLSLIHRGECSTSTVTPGESEFFLTGDELVKELEDDDDDDLLDMI